MAKKCSDCEHLASCKDELGEAFADVSCSHHAQSETSASPLMLPAYDPNWYENDLYERAYVNKEFAGHPDDFGDH